MFHPLLGKPSNITTYTMKFTFEMFSTTYTDWNDRYLNYYYLLE